MSAGEAWVARASAILDELRGVLEPFGVALASDLCVTSDAHPCPGYLHDERRIAFCPPVVEGPIDRARWLFFSRMMGCTGVEEAAEFYEAALPLIVCHEASHHLRMSRAVASPSHFVEEQACDRLAVAMVRAMPRHRETLGPLRALCERMVKRLAVGFADAPGASFVSDVADVLVATSVVDRNSLDALERLAARDDLALVDLLALLPAVSSTTLHAAQVARESAQKHVDSHYTSNASEYWHLGLTWVGSYLSRAPSDSLGAQAARDALADTLQADLLGHEDARRIAEVEAALHAMLDDAAHRAAAAEGLLELRGEAAVAALVEHARAHDDVLAALVRAWPSDRSWASAPVASLVAVMPRVERAHLQLRLAGVSGLTAPAIDEALESDRLALERIAANGATGANFTDADATRAKLLRDPGATLDAWTSHARSLTALADVLGPSLFGPVALETRARRSLLRLAARTPNADARTTESLAFASLALDELADPAGPRGDDEAANADAHTVLRAGAADEVAALATSRLPARGGPGWRELIIVLGWSGVATADDESSGEHALRRRLRGAAARADLSCAEPTRESRARATRDDPDCLVAARAIVARAAARRAFADALRSSPTRSVATVEYCAAALRESARDDALEVIRALAAQAQSDAVAKLCDRVIHDGAVGDDDTVRAVLIDSLATPWRAPIAALLAPDRPLGQAARAMAPELVPTLPPIVTAALAGEDQAMLTTIEKLVQLRMMPLFATIALDHLRGLAALAVVESFAAGETIFADGDPGDRLYLVLAGQVAIEKVADGRIVTLDLLGASSAFGEMSLFDGAPRSATARARTPCTLLTLSRAAVARVGREEPQIYESFLRVLAARLRTTNLAFIGAGSATGRPSRA